MGKSVGETGSCSDGWGRAQSIFDPTFYWRRLPLSSLPPSESGLRSKNKEGTQPHTSTENWIKDLLSMAPSIRRRSLTEKCEKWKCSQSVLSLRPHGPSRLLYPWDFPGKITGVGCYFLLQGIFPTQGLNLGLLHCRQTLYHLSHKESSLIENLLINYGSSM